MKTFNQYTLEEAKVHPMAVHAYSVGGGSYKVHAVGSKVEHVKAGETIRSSDLDDLTDAGHKVKEINKPMNEALGTIKNIKAASKFKPENISAMRNAEKARNYPKSPTGMGHSADADFNQQSKKMQDAINLHLRNGKDYAEAVKAAKVHVKEAHSSDSIGDHKGLKAYANSLGPKHIDRHDLLTAASHMAFGNMDHLKKHLKALDTDVRDKVKEYMKEEADQIDEANSHREVDNLKSKGKHHEAGQHAAKSGHDRQYGAHFGMRSDKEEAQRQFFKGYDSVKKTNEEADIDEALGTIKNMKAASKFSSSNVSDMIRGEKARKAGMAKVSTTRDIGYKVVDVGPGQKETVRKMHNFKEEEDLDEASSAMKSLASKKKSGIERAHKELHGISSKRFAIRQTDKSKPTKHRVDIHVVYPHGEERKYQDEVDAKDKHDAIFSTQIKYGKFGKKMGYSVDKVVHKGMVKEEEDQINEISSDTLISYSQKAHNQIKGNQPADPDKLRKRTNREQGIKLAFNKHYQVRTKVPATIKEEEIDEMHSIGSTALTYHDHIEAKEMTPAEIKAKHKSYLDTEAHHRKRSKDPNITSNQRMASGAVASAAKMAAAEWKHKYMKEEAESGLSTKTLAGYSIKASDASKHRKLPTSKVDNRYAGVSKVDKILAARDKKKVD